MQAFTDIITTINNILWANWVLYVILGTGVIYTFWSIFSQYRSITHGTQVLRGKYDDKNDPGAISHFQALSAALSATVGLGNIGGVALAIALGGPGAVFWMWVVGFFGMALKLTEVTLSMLYRDTSDPHEPHGGPMYVVSKGLENMNPKFKTLGKFLGTVFCLTLLVSAVTGGNMFQAWNVADLTQEYFGVPQIATGIILAVMVAAVIIGGIRRIGSVAGRLVPFMVVLYLLAGTVVLIVNADKILPMLGLIISSAFNPHEAAGAFIGGTAATAFALGMKRALFSNEAGQGSSPIAHSAARTKEPVREGIVAGLEPFIDTIVVCTFTALIILSTGIWNRAAEANYVQAPQVVAGDNLGEWTIASDSLPNVKNAGLEDLAHGNSVYMFLEGDDNAAAGNKLHQLAGLVVEEKGRKTIDWGMVRNESKPSVKDGEVYKNMVGATLTAKAFDSVTPGLGKWLVTLASWLFAISTMISWSYYGEQGMIYMLGKKSVVPYKLVYCLLIIVATSGIVKTTADLDNFSSLGTGVMLWINIPIILFFGYQAMKAYKDYVQRLKDGRMGEGHEAPTIEDLLSGRVE
jgi:AGCS family alanine or glycine:cation symporter